LRKTMLGFILTATLLISTFMGLAPPVFADYTVHHASFPPDLPGDVNNDGVVNILDATLVSSAFGSTFGSATWDPRCDLNDDGVINILDASLV